MSKVKETLAKCHFSAMVIGPTILFTALPQTTLRVLGKSCYIAETTDGFIAYPRAEEDEYPGDTIVVSSSYFGSNRDFHEYFIIKIGWKNGSPEVIEITNTCTNDNQLLIAHGHLSLRIGEIAYTTSHVPPKEETRFHVSYDTLCEHDAGVVDADKLHEIAQKIKDGQKQEEAETIESLKERIGYLNSELSETRNSLDSLRNDLRDKTNAMDILKEEKSDLQSRLALSNKQKEIAKQLQKSLEVLLVDASGLLKASLDKPGKRFLFWNDLPTIQAQEKLKETLTVSNFDNHGTIDFPNIKTIKRIGNLTLFFDK